ncbi:MAG: type II toxin-antitoxin system RelE/ParE family toxin [Gammaproteobacteria bacterium]|nr:type II toxin-antitoxin system RelE/ParE family toxin [Gammaproteobacteria bacterium]
MSEWQISYLDVVENFFDNLSDPQFKSLTKEIKLLAKCGNRLRLPHSRALGDGLFELRERRYGYRIYYIFCKNKEILLLHVGDKKTQVVDIKVARTKLNRMH